MKKALKAPFAYLCAVLARAVLRKYRPTIVMVTGSVGKTSTKDAIAAALSEKFYLRASEKSYNSEFGVPFTIFGVENPWTSTGAWVGVFLEAFALILFPNHYPKLLVLEVGADRPGDLKRILKIATPNAVVVTKLPEVPVHVEAYPTPAAVREEEFLPALALTAGSPLIISSDDPYSSVMAARLSATLSTVGFATGSSVQLEDDDLLLEQGRMVGMRATARVGSASYPLLVRGALGRPQLYAPASAFALALALNLSPKEALAGLASYMPPPGRTRLLAGKNASLLIDDSYNSSPTANIEALETLKEVPNAKRRIAILGDMLELGRYSIDAHEEIGTLAAKSADRLVAVGKRARVMQEAAIAAGMPAEDARAYDTSTEAAEALVDLIREGDVILIKGSQSVRMERIVEAFLANPADTKQLVRQDTEWKRR